jgi:hypothetical protein
LREEYANEQLEFPTMEEFLELHKGGEAYRIFLSKIVERIVGKHIWNNNCDKKPLSKFCTRSNEAFGLLLLENCYDRWTDMWRSGDHKDKNKQASPSLYTNSGDTRGQKGSNRKLEGWSKQGYERFDVLHRLVTDDREKPGRAAFEEELRVELEAERAGKRSKKKPRLEVSQVGSYPAHDFDDVLEGGGTGLAKTDEQAKDEENDDEDCPNGYDDEEDEKGEEQNEMDSNGEEEEEED